MIPFNKPFLTGKEIEFITEAHERGQLAGDGFFTRKCNEWLEAQTGAHKALLTHSCTAALEMAAILADIQPGDEVIMPSYTFVSTANAFVLRGGMPVFVDIRSDTLNIDEKLIERAITSRTKAIVVVHYAGVACNMSQIMDVARRHSLLVIEDAAQAVMSLYQGLPLGSIGDFGCYSFHETKNIISGEGGALIINNPEFVEKAEIIREKGTNRTQFSRGSVDKYTWVDKGSSFLPGELIAAFLYAQMTQATEITRRRLNIWSKYYDFFSTDHCPQDSISIDLPVVPSDCTHNAHMFYLLLPTRQQRDLFISKLKHRDISTVFHYIPLHSSPFFTEYSSELPLLPVTDDVSSRIVRLPLWCGLEEFQAQVFEACRSALA